jgi:formyltetrahydrofolate deformylase
MLALMRYYVSDHHSAFSRQSIDCKTSPFLLVSVIIAHSSCISPLCIKTMTSIPTSGKEAILRVYGPDKKGIVAAFSQLLYGHGCGIVEAEQCTDKAANLFFQRIRFDYAEMHTDQFTIENSIKEVCERFEMKMDLNWCQRKKRVAIMVSKYDHCLWEVLLRYRAGELSCDIVAILSNHPDLKTVADTFEIPFHHFPMSKETKVEQEAAELKLMKEKEVDLVVLARYMQIISDNFCKQFDNKVINIHHSFLPAFVGGKPYHRAFERGVKIIGATVRTNKRQSIIAFASVISHEVFAFILQGALCHSRVGRRPYHSAGYYPYFSSRRCQRLDSKRQNSRKEHPRPCCCRTHRRSNHCLSE